MDHHYGEGGWHQPSSSQRPTSHTPILVNTVWRKSIWKTIVKNDYGDKDFETMSHIDLWIL